MTYDLPKTLAEKSKAGFNALNWLINKCDWLDTENGQFRGNLPARMACTLQGMSRNGACEKDNRSGDLAYCLSWKQNDKVIFLRWKFGSYRSIQNVILFTLTAVSVEDVAEIWQSTL